MTGPDQSITIVLLAGTLRPSPLRRGLGVPELCLPLGAEETLLDAWLACLRHAAGGLEGMIVVDHDADVETIGLPAPPRPPCPLRVVADPAPWRGTAGVLRDVTGSLRPDDLVLTVEASCLPPRTLAPLVEAIGPGDAGVIGVADDGEPAGVHLLRRSALRSVPGVGYHDVKEQLLPRLYEEGRAVRAVTLASRVRRVRDRMTYLDAVRDRMAETGGPRPVPAPTASVSSSALLDGFAIVGAGAVVQDGAIVQDSVIMDGAVVGGGAVVSRSVVGPAARIEARSRCIGELIVAGEEPMLALTAA